MTKTHQKKIDSYFRYRSSIKIKVSAYNIFHFALERVT